MIEAIQARELAAAALRFPDMSLGDVRELRDGWYFSYVTNRVGSNGVIVNKRTGRIFELGSAFPVERDLRIYDRGWHAAVYDLVVLSIRDLRETRRAIGRLRLTTLSITYESGQVWRINKPMTEAERSARLDSLPCIFPEVGLYFDFEVLEEVREAGWFTFDAVEYRPPKM